MKSTQLWYAFSLMLSFSHLILNFQYRQNMESGKFYRIDGQKGSQSPTRRDGSKESKFLPNVTGLSNTMKSRGSKRMTTLFPDKIH